MRLDLESLRAFATVLEWGSMARAAEQLELSPSAMSWKIKRLEQRVGRPLLIRDGHELRPTQEGRLILEEAPAMLEAHDRLVRRLTHPEFTGTIKIGSNEEVGAARMAGILGRFRFAYPDATIEFVVNQSRLLLPLLNRGRIDVAVVQVTEEEVQPDDVVLWTEELRWATHRDLPYDDGVVNLISYGENGFYRPVGEPILEQHGISYRYTVTAPTSAAVRAAVSAGLGVAILASQWLTAEVVEWEVGSTLEALPRSCQVVRTVPGEQPTVTRAIVDAIVEEFTDLHERSGEQA
ncbi:MAG: LysR family transcriptional regulator [Acidimicrobiia bacterium]|nr:LysR family transcriptional regulator [Acidimicrobiia bacterium]